MREIHSGSSTKRVVRTALAVLIVNVFAVFFLWDGFIRYPVANAAQLAKTLGLPLPVPPPIHPELTADQAQEFVKTLEKKAAPSVLTDRWGEPGLRHEGMWYFLGPGGHLGVQVAGEQLEMAEWHVGLHSDQDLKWQRVIGAVLGAIGVICVVNLIRTVMGFATLTEVGLHVTGQRVIAWEEMVSVTAPPNDKFRRVVLNYLVDGRERRLLLDDDAIRDRDAIVAAVCERKGFAVPSGID